MLRFDKQKRTDFDEGRRLRLDVTTNDNTAFITFDFLFPRVLLAGQKPGALSFSLTLITLCLSSSLSPRYKAQFQMSSDNMPRL